MSNYQPVNCEFHDVIEACATLRKPVTILVENTDGTQRAVHAIISDVFARDGVEYLKTRCEELIRLDELLAVDGHEIRNFVQAPQMNINISTTGFLEKERIMISVTLCRDGCNICQRISDHSPIERYA
jgi:Rho-binding antiterminator